MRESRMPRTRIQEDLRAVEEHSATNRSAGSASPKADFDDFMTARSRRRSGAGEEVDGVSLQEKARARAGPFSLRVQLAASARAACRATSSPRFLQRPLERFRRCRPAPVRGLGRLGRRRHPAPVAFAAARRPSLLPRSGTSMLDLVRVDRPPSSPVDRYHLRERDDQRRP